MGTIGDMVLTSQSMGNDIFLNTKKMYSQLVREIESAELDTIFCSCPTTCAKKHVFILRNQNCRQFKKILLLDEMLPSRFPHWRRCNRFQGVAGFVACTGDGEGLVSTASIGFGRNQCHGNAS